MLFVFHFASFVDYSGILHSSAVPWIWIIKRFKLHHIHFLVWSCLIITSSILLHLVFSNCVEFVLFSLCWINFSILASLIAHIAANTEATKHKQHNQTSTYSSKQHHFLSVFWLDEELVIPSLIPNVRSSVGIILKWKFSIHFVSAWNCSYNKVNTLINCEILINLNCTISWYKNSSWIFNICTRININFDVLSYFSKFKRNLSLFKVQIRILNLICAYLVWWNLPVFGFVIHSIEREGLLFIIGFQYQILLTSKSTVLAFNFWTICIKVVLWLCVCWRTDVLFSSSAFLCFWPWWTALYFPAMFEPGVATHFVTLSAGTCEAIVVCYLSWGQTNDW